MKECSPPKPVSTFAELCETDKKKMSLSLPCSISTPPRRLKEICFNGFQATGSCLPCKMTNEVHWKGYRACHFVWSTDDMHVTVKLGLSFKDNLFRNCFLNPYTFFFITVLTYLEGFNSRWWPSFTNWKVFYSLEKWQNIHISVFLLIKNSVTDNNKLQL